METIKRAAKENLNFFNGNIITLDPRQPSAENLIIEDGKIAQLDAPLPGTGSGAAGTDCIDLRGKTVIPGLADSHVHLLHVGLGLTFASFREAASVSDMLDGISDGLKDHPRGEIFLGWDFDDNLFREKRLPTMDELNSVSTETPIWVNRIGMNASVFNAKAWEMVPLPPDLPTVGTDSNGKILGFVSGDANWVALARILNVLSDDVRMAAYRAAAAHCASKGVTSVHAMEGCFSPSMIDNSDFACRDVPCLIRGQDDIDMDIAIWYQHIVDYQKDITRVKAWGLPRIAGDIFMDGVLGAAMTKGVLRAALFEPYADAPSSYGDLLFSDEEIETFVALSRKAGLQFSAHAVGDRSFSQLMTAYEKAFENTPGDGRYRIEHCILPDRTKFDLAARLGVVFSMQPAFDYYSGGPDGRYAGRVGPERAHLTNPFRDILDAGCKIVGGSDSPVNPIDPIFGIHCMVNHHYPAQRVSPMEALRAFTADAAFSVFEEEKRGTLTPGKQADLVVLSDDPLTVSPGKIRDIEVEMTLHKGKITYQGQSFK